MRQYEDRVKGWFLRWGRKLQQHHDAGFVVLMVAVGYLEGNQQYRRGESSDHSSKAFVKEALQRLFEWISPAEAANFYGVVRCGLFHDGMTKHGVAIENRAEQALAVTDGRFLVSPNKFLDLVAEDFELYLEELRTPGSATLANFLNRWDG